MLATFSLKVRQPSSRRVCVFCWVYVLFRFLGRPDHILAPFCLHLGRSGLHLGSIWEVFGLILAPGAKLAICRALLAQELAMDGLVGLQN